MGIQLRGMRNIACILVYVAGITHGNQDATLSFPTIQTQRGDINSQFSSGKLLALAHVILSSTPASLFSISAGQASLGSLRKAGGAPHEAMRRVASPAMTDAAKVSQTEDLVANAKELLFTPLGPRQASKKLTTKAALRNTLSGLTVSLAMIPEAVAFAFVAGVSPIVGLQTTAVMGFFAAAFGGRGGITTGASGACSVVVAPLVKAYGVAMLPAAACLAGIIQTLMGVLGFGKFIRLVPHPTMLGFVNGLALVMTKAQLMHFRAPLAAGLFSAKSVTMTGLTALTMSLIKVLPKITRAVPPSLAAVIIVSCFSSILNLPATKLIDIAGPEAFQGGLAVLPKFGIPALSSLAAAPLKTLGIIGPAAATMALVGLVESLLTLQLVDGIVDDGTRGSTRQECIGQGLANIFSGFTGGQGGCALIGQSLINTQSGGTSRLSGIVMSLGLGAGLVSAAPLLGQVPIAAFVGVMLLVCKSTFAWSSLRLVGRIPTIDLVSIAAVSIVTVWRDLAQAAGLGIIINALSFAWQQSTNIRGRVVEGADPHPNMSPQESAMWRTYRVDGPLFFGSAQSFSSIFNPKEDPDDVVIDFMGSRIMDHSGLDAINKLAERYGQVGKRVHLRHLSSDCYGLLERLNGEKRPYELFEPDIREDPIYEVAENPSVYKDVAAPKKPDS